MATRKDRPVIAEGKGYKVVAHALPERTNKDGETLPSYSYPVIEVDSDKDGNVVTLSRQALAEMHETVANWTHENISDDRFTAPDAQRCLVSGINREYGLACDPSRWSDGTAYRDFVREIQTAIRSKDIETVRAMRQNSPEFAARLKARLEAQKAAAIAAEEALA